MCWQADWLAEVASNARQAACHAISIIRFCLIEQSAVLKQNTARRIANRYPALQLPNVAQPYQKPNSHMSALSAAVRHHHHVEHTASRKINARHLCRCSGAANAAVATAARVCVKKGQEPREKTSF
jgi:hypothetical protein